MKKSPLEELTIYIRKEDKTDFINAEIVVLIEDRRDNVVIFNKFIRKTSKKIKSHFFKHVITKDRFLDKYDQIILNSNDKVDIVIDKLFSVKKRTETGESSLVKILGYDEFRHMVYYRKMYGVWNNGDQILSSSIIASDLEVFLLEHYKLNNKS